MLTYVLNNTSDSNPSSRTPKFVRPTVLGNDRLVQYIWSFDDSLPESLEFSKVIVSAARHIRCLGWGIDTAYGNGETLQFPPKETAGRLHFNPSSTASAAAIDIRVPARGSLYSLEENYAAYLQRYRSNGFTSLEPAGAVFEPTAYVIGEERPTVSFRLVNSDGGPVSIRHSLIKPLVGMMRNLASESNIASSFGKEIVDSMLLGHSKHGSADHLSIIPLPTIREGPTDGWIRRVMLAEPRGSDGTLVRRLGQLLDGEELKPLSGENRFPKMILERLDQTDNILPYYLGTSSSWATVTPILLPGYDDRKTHRGDQTKCLARARQLVCKALRQAGISITGQVELSRAPFWSGSLHIREYDPRDKHAHYPRWHVRLTLDRPLSGPLSIGAGRYCGFGIMGRFD